MICWDHALIDYATMLITGLGQGSPLEVATDETCLHDRQHVFLVSLAVSKKKSSAEQHEKHAMFKNPLEKPGDIIASPCHKVIFHAGSKSLDAQVCLSDNSQELLPLLLTSIL